MVIKIEIIESIIIGMKSFKLIHSDHLLSHLLFLKRLTIDGFYVVYAFSTLELCQRGWLWRIGSEMVEY